MQDIPESVHLSLGTTSDVMVGQLVGRFARECQVSYLTSRVLRHIQDPVSDSQFYQAEAIQLERTLKSFVPILMEEDTKYGLYCSAFAICTRSDAHGVEG